MRPVILLFAKAPRPGHVKTRLAREIGAEQAAKFHQACVGDMLEMLDALRDVADSELHTDIETDAWREFRVPRGLQASGDLGHRMLAALEGALARGCPQAMVVGSDAPTLPTAYIRGLLGMSEDVALGPTEDGGYYAIACRRTHQAMFDGVAWSGPEAFLGTVRAAEAAGLTVESGETWFDVDEKRDLDRLLATGGLGRRMRSWAGAYARQPECPIQVGASGLTEEAAK